MRQSRHYGRTNVLALVMVVGMLSIAGGEVQASSSLIIPVTPARNSEEGSPSLARRISPTLSSSACSVPGDYATIQEAVADLDCDAIAVSAGTYEEEITISRDLTVRGTGGTSVIKAPGVFMGSPRAILRVTAGASVTIEKLKITGPGPLDDDDGLIGVLVDHGAIATIRNNTITTLRPPGKEIGTGSNFIGVSVGSAANATTGIATIVQNRIENYQQAGIVIDGVGSSATVSGNIVLGTGLHTDGQAVSHGIQISRGAGADVVHNVVRDHRYQSLTRSAGILVFDAGDSLATLEHNTTLGNDIGIWVIGTDNAVIEHNGARDSVYDGIALENQNATSLGLAVNETTDGHSVRFNSTSRNGGAGIVLRSSNNNVVAVNRGKKNAETGVRLTCACDYTVNPSCAPGCGASPDFQPNAHGNTVTKNRYKNNGVGMVDESTGGSGPVGVDNNYARTGCKLYEPDKVL